MANEKLESVTQGEPEREYCFFCGARIYFENGAIPVWRHHGSNFAESLSPFQHYAKPRPAQPSPVVAGIPIRTDPTIPKDVILLAGATSIKAVNVGDVAPVVPVGETAQKDFDALTVLIARTLGGEQWADADSDQILEAFDPWDTLRNFQLPATEKEN